MLLEEEEDTYVLHRPRLSSLPACAGTALSSLEGAGVFLASIEGSPIKVRPSQTTRRGNYPGCLPLCLGTFVMYLTFDVTLTLTLQQSTKGQPKVLSLIKASISLIVPPEFSQDVLLCQRSRHNKPFLS